jgi:hypothetical protein
MASYINVIDDNFFTTEFKDDIVTNTGINILFIFLLSIIVFIPIRIKRYEFKKDSFVILLEQNSKLILTSLIIGLTYIFFFQFDLPKKIGDSGQPHPLYEYAIQIFIIGFYFIGRNKYYTKILIAILLVFALQNFLYGGRIIGLQLVLVYFLFFWGYKAKINKIWPVMIIGFLLLSVIGMNRGNADFSMESIRQAIRYLSKNSMSLDTAYSAYYTSLTFLKKLELISFGERIGLLFSFIKSIFFGGQVKNSVLPYVTGEIFINYGGGIFPIYFKFYLGWFGVFLSGLLVAAFVRIINRIGENTNGFIICLALFFVTTVFRWYLYTPLIVLRGVVFLVVIYLIVSLVHNSFRIKRFKSTLKF